MSEPMNVFNNKLTPIMWPDAIVSGAGSPEVDGTYKFLDYYNGRPRWSKVDTTGLAYIQSTGLNWIIEHQATNASYDSSGLPLTPWLDSYSPNAGLTPAPTVTSAQPLLLPQGILTVQTTFQDLNQLGLPVESRGAANAILIGTTPDWNPVLGGRTPFFYLIGNTAGDALIPPGIGFTQAPTDGKDTSWNKPLLIEGRENIDNLKLAGGQFGHTLYYQLLTGSV